MSESLQEYYSRVFPASSIYRWLSNGRDPRSRDTVLEDTFPRREFSFTLPGDIYCRHKSFSSPEELQNDLFKQRPDKIDIGAVWTIPPVSRNSYTNTVRYETVEKEFVIDIDMTDYDNVRTCCKGATVCQKCWKFLAVACKSVDLALRESFGFDLRLWVFSGRRGVHCWVSDPEAKRLNDSRRKPLIDFLISAPKSHTPFFEIYDGILKNAFEEIIINDQDCLVNPEHIQTILDIINECDKRQSEKKNSEKTDKIPLIKDRISQATSSQELWDAIKNDLTEEVKMRVIFKFLYPRLDVHVSTHTNHLLKAPFSIHPSTQKVCIPFDLEEVDSFDLSEVPSVDQAVAGDLKYTKSVEFFEKFILKVKRRYDAERRQLAQMNRMMDVDESF